MIDHHPHTIRPKPVPSRHTAILVVIDVEMPAQDNPNPWSVMVERGIEDDLRQILSRYGHVLAYRTRPTALGGV